MIATVLPASAVQTIAGVLSFVKYGLVLSPPILVSTGALGAVVSTISVTELPVVVPPPLVAVDVYVPVPFGKVTGQTEKFPELSTTPVAKATHDELRIVITDPLVPVPTNVTAPLSNDHEVGEVITGALGATSVSTLNGCVRGLLTSQKLFFAVAVIVYEPSTNVIPLSGIVYTQNELATPVKVCPLTVSVTSIPLPAVPTTVRPVLLVNTAHEAGAVIVGVDGVTQAGSKPPSVIVQLSELIIFALAPEPRQYLLVPP